MSVNTKTLSAVRKYLSSSLNFHPNLTTLNFSLLDKGSCKATYTVKKEDLNGHGTLHGGMMSTLLNSCADFAAVSQNVGEKSDQTLSFNIQCLRVGKLNETVSVEAEIVKLGGKVIFLEGSLTGENGKLLAKATQTKQVKPGPHPWFV